MNHLGQAKFSFPLHCIPWYDNALHLEPRDVSLLLTLDISTLSFIMWFITRITLGGGLVGLGGLGAFHSSSITDSVTDASSSDASESYTSNGN